MCTFLLQKSGNFASTLDVNKLFHARTYLHIDTNFNLHFKVYTTYKINAAHTFLRVNE